MKAFVIFMLIVHAIAAGRAIHRLGRDQYPLTEVTTRTEAAFILLPTCLAIIAWAAWALVSA
jgi:hypothetical protein